MAAVCWLVIMSVWKQREGRRQKSGAYQMDLHVDIYQCGNSHVHVVLRGQVQGEAVFGDFEVFAQFIAVCQDFVNKHSPIPQAFLDAFDSYS